MKKITPCTLFVIISAMLVAVQQCVIAGPPFQTDDPVPVPYRHLEIYLGTLYTHDVDSLSIDGPFAEADYGPLQNIQLSLTVPMTYQRNYPGRCT